MQPVYSKPGKQGKQEEKNIILHMQFINVHFLFFVNTFLKIDKGSLQARYQILSYL